MKRAIIVHGWASDPEDCWFPWLKGELEACGYQVDVPAMPNPQVPVIEVWVGHLQKTLGSLDSETMMIGHSIGCQTILRFLETQDTPIRGAVFVAGFFELAGLRSDEERMIAKPWMEEAIDLKKVRHALPRSVAIFSDNDRWVPIEVNSQAFQEKLGSAIVIEHARGHFTGEGGVFELPSVMEAVRRLEADSFHGFFSSHPGF